MITVEEAKRIVIQRVIVGPSRTVQLKDALGRSLSQPVIAPVDHPRFDMSAVDGYAFRFAEEVKEWKVVGSIAAGEVLENPIRPGECARIFTGAEIPAGTDSVVMQEWTTVANGQMTYDDVRLRKGANVRYRGEQARKGDPLLDRGHVMNAPSIGLLASFGITDVRIHAQPVVSVVITGNEFTTATDAAPGRIFNSNGVMLRTALNAHAAQVLIEQAPDDRRSLAEALERAQAMSEVIISTGGASVGDHDLVVAVVAELGGTIHFHGVAQKPGKPMLFASLNGKPFFGLPGNPRAVMVLFWEYVLPFLCAMQGAKDPWPKCDLLPVTHGANVKGERAEFRAATVKNGSATLLADEGSHMLSTLATADALAYIPAHVRELKEGDPLEVHYLPHR